MAFVTPLRDRHLYVLGIDIGHGETSASVCEIQWDNTAGVLPAPEDLQLEGSSEALPSALLIEKHSGNGCEKENYQIGYSARHYSKLALRNNIRAEFYDCFKKPPAKANAEEKRIMRLFMQEVYKRCLEKATCLQPGNHIAYIACPSSEKKWDEDCKFEYAKIAVEAGLPIARIVDPDAIEDSLGVIRESRAAFLYARNKLENTNAIQSGFLLIDFGSSTVDLTYYAANLAKPIDFGWECGASNVEKILLEHTLREKNIEVTESVKNLLMYDVRKSKEKFYSEGQAFFDIYFRLNEYNLKDSGSIDASYEDSDINCLLTEYRECLRYCFDTFKKKYLQDKYIGVIMLTGGASRMDFISDIAKEVFEFKGVPSRETNPSVTVSRGIAFAGRADMRIYEMKKKLLADKEVFEQDISQAVIDKAVENLTKKVMELVAQEVNKFADDPNYGTATVAGLKEKIKQKSSGVDYTQPFTEACMSVCIEAVNRSIQNKLNSVVKTYFPYYKLSKINIQNKRQLSVELKDLKFNKLDEIVRYVVIKTVSKIWRGLNYALGIVISAAVGIFCGTLMSRPDGGSFLGYKTWEWYEKTFIGEDKYPSGYKYEYHQGDINKSLSAEERKKAKNTFLGSKDSIEADVRREIANSLKTDANFVSSINGMYRDVLKNYIVEQINKVRFMLN